MYRGNFKGGKFNKFNNKNKPPCANPHIEKWLLEWRDDAREKESKLAFVYGNALQSLRKYPLPLNSGRECKMLKFFGDKICARIDKKLEAMNRDDGDSDNDETDYSDILKAAPKAKKAKVTPTTSTSTPPQAAGKRKQASAQSYIPAYRSGPYALLLTLLRKEECLSYPGFTMKAELMRDAQEFCEASFTVPAEGTRYTAWSSMANLLKKGLIHKYGNPSRFNLSPEGRDLAAKLEHVSSANDGGGADDDRQPPSSSQSTSCESSPKRDRFGSQGNDRNSNRAASPKKKKGGGGAFFTNEDFLDDPLLRDDFAAPTKGAARKRQKKATTATATRADAFASSGATSTAGGSRGMSQGSAMSEEADDGGGGSLSASSSQQSTCSSEKQVFESFILEPGQFDIILVVDNCEASGFLSGTAKEQRLAMINELDALAVNYEVKRLGVGDFVWICREKVDHRQQQDLASAATIVRPPKSKELVLPYVIERKRLDDLASSIKDGRFREQKFRLKHCGLSRPMYLIENYAPASGSDSAQNRCGLPDASLAQAVANIQVTGGFNVQYCKDSKATARFLCMMTRLIHEQFNDKMLISCSLDDAKERRSSSDDFLFPIFDEFNAASVKQKRFTVEQMFTKHLLQIRGLSVAKARAITAAYATPARLFQAYHNATTGAASSQQTTAKDKLLSGLMCEGSPGMAKRTLGAAISKSVATMYDRKFL